MNKLAWLKKIIWVLIGLTVLGVVNLYLGGGYLTNPLIGGDVGHALAHINYLYKYWPQRTLWQSFHGAGASLRGINYGAFWLAAMTAKVLGWTPIQAMHFWRWLTMYLTSLGIMALGGVIFTPFLGLLAGIFFLLSHISWIWESRTGLFAFQTSFIWVPFFFIFFHKYLEGGRERSLFKQRFFLVLAACVLALSFWFHLVVGVVIAEAAFLYALFFPFSGKSSFLWRFLGWIKIMSLGILLSFFWWLPFVFYNQQILGGKVEYFTFESLPMVPWRIFLGLTGFSNQRHDIWFGFFALPVLILTALGVFLALWRKNKAVIILFLLSLVFFFQATANQVAPSLVKLFLFYFSLLNTRVILMTIIFLPLVAGFGAVATAKFVFSKLKDSKLKSVLVLTTTLLLVGFLVWRLDRLPPGYIGFCGSSYGPEGIVVSDDCSLVPSEVILTSLKVITSPNDQGPSCQSLLKEVALFIPKSDNLRADMTSRRGEYIQNWSMVSSIPLLQSTDFISVIPIQFWNYQEDVFYQGKGNKGEIEQIAAWFGIDYVILDADHPDPFEKFSRWPAVGSAKAIQIFQSPQPVGLATHSNRSAILFFGDPKQDAYFNWWQLLVDGGLDYKEAFTVDGGRRIEDYAKDELSRFATLVFWGEEYKSLEKANNLIRDYLEQGGRVLIDTGWEYTSPWWEKEELPDWLPIKATHWQSFDNWELVSDDPNLERLVSFWAPPRWDDQPWGASVANQDKLRPQAEVLIIDQITNNILAARMPVGDGEIIWTGLNLVAMHQMKDKKASQLMNTWLGGGKTKDFLVDVNRLGPERVEIELKAQSEPTWLYWRESFYPSWRTKLSDGTKLSFYKGGPGLMLIYLPPNSSKVIFSHKTHWSTILGGIVTTLTGVGILLGFVHAYWVVRKFKKEE